MDSQEEPGVLEKDLLTGKVDVDGYASALVRADSLEHALKEILLLRNENQALQGRLARSTGDFTDEVFVSLKRERDALVEQALLVFSGKLDLFIYVYTLFKVRNLH
jgi:hypothetical protein